MMRQAQKTGTAPLYEIRDLVCAYGDEPVLHIDRLDISSDGPTAFVGHNGSGKSTLLKALAFLLKPAAGTIRFLGEPTEERGRGTPQGSDPPPPGTLSPPAFRLRERGLRPSGPGGHGPSR